MKLFFIFAKRFIWGVWEGFEYVYECYSLSFVFSYLLLKIINYCTELIFAHNQWWNWSLVLLVFELKFFTTYHALLRLQIFFIKHDFRNQPLWRAELSHVDIDYIRLHGTIFQSNKKSRHPDKFRTLIDPKYMSEIRWHKSHGGVLKFKTLAFQSNRGRDHKLTTI